MKRSRFSQVVTGACAGLAVLGLAGLASGQTSSPPSIIVPEDAKPGAEVVVTLESGETLRCIVEEVKADTIVLKHPVLGKIEAPRAKVTSVVVETPAPPPPPPPPPPAFTEGWKGSVQGGLNGSDGNSETLSFRFGVNLNRLTETMETRVSAFYTYASDNGEKSQSRGEFIVQNDWIFKDSPWGWFVKGRADYDEFQDWDWLLSGSTGPSYTFIRNEDTMFRVRAGAGASKQFGGDDEDVKPELNFGADLTHTFKTGHKFFFTTDYYPDLEEISEFRWNTRAGYEIMIDPETNMSLRLGIDNRYMSDPGPGRENNDIDYFALLAWSF
jgi:hypothetical protein